jgi:hypothetical protein
MERNKYVFSVIVQLHSGELRSCISNDAAALLHPATQWSDAIDSSGYPMLQSDSAATLLYNILHYRYIPRRLLSQTGQHFHPLGELNSSPLPGAAAAAYRRSCSRAARSTSSEPCLFNTAFCDGRGLMLWQGQVV